MMTSALVLILAILLLGGLIAALGDRLGTKIGKARLRIFNLRPKQTAILVTVVTGVLIAASTLGILFALSKSLRQGIFDLDDILRKKNQAEGALNDAKAQMADVQSELNTALEQRANVTKQLEAIKSNFAQAQTRLNTLTEQREQLAQEITTLAGQRKVLDQQIDQLIGDIDVLEQETDGLQEEIKFKDNLLASLKGEVTRRDRELKNKEDSLDDLEVSIGLLEQEVNVLESYYQNYQQLRINPIAIGRGETIASAVMQSFYPETTIKTINELLRVANLRVLEAIYPNENLEDIRDRQVLQITEAQVEELVNFIKDGREYVVRIVSAGNHLKGEEKVFVYPEAMVNEQKFRAGSVIATLYLDSNGDDDVKETIEALMASSQFRSFRAGVLGRVQVLNGDVETFVKFKDRLVKSQPPIEKIQAIALTNTFTAGPLKLQLLAIRNDQIIFTATDVLTD